jgi:dihydrofolate reductase
MTKLIVSEFVTLDGVMEAPGGEPSHPHTGWVVDHHTPELEEYKLQEVLAAGTLLIGRVTYESFSKAWPARTGEFAVKMNSMPKVVVSSTIDRPYWARTTVLDGDVVKGVAELKEGEGDPILVVGSGTLVHTLLEHDLVDELRLMTFPVSIGAGLRVFPDTVRKAAWALADTVALPNDVRVDAYRPA